MPGQSIQRDFQKSLKISGGNSMFLQNIPPVGTIFTMVA
ncbi:MAG: hypothetical protein FD159_1707 [Syntrophaceae bacterium]|nr:MAG: hypothetical protein FD159_1707 [Syntrophaceae bacterium]